MKKLQILFISILLIVIGLTILLMLIKIVQSESVRDYYTYTKAICDNKNFCQDYIVVCENKQITKTSPITGASIQQSENWQDPRITKSKISCD